MRVLSRSFSSEVPFGFKNVAKDEKQNMVGEVFSKVADNYDKMNDLMSAGVHRAWKDEFVRMLGPCPGSVCLDLAGGTGDISFRIFNAIKDEKHQQYVKHGITKMPSSEVILSDINPEMLEVGKSRAKQLGYDKSEDPKMSFMEINAENIPFEDKSMDCVTIAFGIRNCTDVPRVVGECHRVLKKGGRFMCLEFSEVSNPIIREVYDMWSFYGIPKLGEIVANDRDSYQYLVESIRRFPSQENFKRIIEEQSFKEVTYTDLMFGVAAIHSGWKLD